MYVQGKSIVDKEFSTIVCLGITYFRLLSDGPPGALGMWPPRIRGTAKCSVPPHCVSVRGPNTSQS